MLADGIYVMLKGKFIGPEKPGPWASLFYKLNIDVFKTGSMFIFLGMVWLIFLAGFWANQNWAYLLGLLVSILSLWYLPIGTIISILLIVLIMTFKKKLQL